MLLPNMTKPAARSGASLFFSLSQNDEQMKHRKSEDAAGFLIHTSKNCPLLLHTACKLNPNFPLRPHMNLLAPVLILLHSATDSFLVQSRRPSMALVHVLMPT